MTPLNSIWKGTFGILALSCSSLSQGHSFRNLMETSKVAPPHTSRLMQSCSAHEAYSAPPRRSYVLTLVASRL